MVRIYHFIPTRPTTMVTVNGVKMTKDQWVYSEVHKILDADRIILSNRYHSPLSDPNSPIGLPK